jgi:Domain of unknown function (DUF4266)
MMKTHNFHRMACALTCAAGVLATGCGSLGVKPRERDIHARADMSPSEQPLSDAIDDHVWFSKEAASGGRTFGGGGCGCN